VENKCIPCFQALLEWQHPSGAGYSQGDEAQYAVFEACLAALRTACRAAAKKQFHMLERRIKIPSTAGRLGTSEARSTSGEASEKPCRPALSSTSSDAAPKAN